MKRENSIRLQTVTLTIDAERHEKLKETSRITRYSMSEITRVALDRLWNDLGDLSEGLSAEAVKILFSSQNPLQVYPETTKGEKT